MLNPIEAGFAPAHSEKASKDGTESGMATQFRKLMNRVLQYTTDFGTEQVEGLLAGIDLGPLPIPRAQVSVPRVETSGERNQEGTLGHRCGDDRARQPDNVEEARSESPEPEDRADMSEEEADETAEHSDCLVLVSVVQAGVKPTNLELDRFSDELVFESEEPVGESVMQADVEVKGLQDDSLFWGGSEGQLGGVSDDFSQENQRDGVPRLGQVDEDPDWDEGLLGLQEFTKESLGDTQVQQKDHQGAEDAVIEPELFDNSGFGEFLNGNKSGASEGSRTTFSQLSDLIKLSSGGKDASKGGDGGSNLLKLAAGLQEVMVGPGAKVVDSTAAAGRAQVHGLSWKQDSMRESLTEGSKRGAQPRAVMSKLFEKVEEIVKDVEKSKDGRSISIRLDPPKLGTVRVQVNVIDGSIHARFSAENPAITQLLRDRADELQALLRKIGQNLDQATISFGGENFSQAQGEKRFPFAGSHEDASANSAMSAGFEVNGEQGMISRSKIHTEHSHWVA